MNCKIQGNNGSGKYANTGTSYGIATYLEHEDLERLKNGEEREYFFNQDKDRISKNDLVKDLDNNKAKLCRSDAKFFVITISPSEKEQLALGATEKERSENLKKFVQENVMQKYAENFNKGLNKSDIKYYAKIHHDREDKEGLNMHCHIIVSRKDQANKIKMSPQTTHTGKKAMGTVKSGFNKNEFYQNVETEFDKRFDYQRAKEESFKYCNTMKHGNIQEIEKLAKENISKEKDQSKGKNINKDKSKGKGGVEL